MKLYLDMDDVVADWVAAAQQILNVDLSRGSPRLPDDVWAQLLNYPRFYLDLPLKAGARELVDHCQQLVRQGSVEGLFFLTALPRDHAARQWAAWDKVLWAQRLFPGIPVFFGPYSADKYMHCEPGDILIDDRSTNCADWRRAGGRAHVYRTWPQCQQWLERLIRSKI